ncbi:hypothetical protein AX16_009301, partial [Volvariella volvacea WC 439]
SKYLLLMVKVLLDVGYNIDCSFNGTLTRSPLGAQVKDLTYWSLVEAFYSYMHNYMCQLFYLTAYMERLSLKDLEGCECFFPNQMC